MDAARVILVTGANKGIGYEIVRALLRDTNDKILVGARDVARGKESVAKLQSEFPNKKENVSLEIIDVGDEVSRSDLAERLTTKFGKLDVVIHNAAIANDPPGIAENARRTFSINYFGLFKLNDLLLPLLKKSQEPRIIILSSGLAQMTFDVCSNKIKKSLQTYATVNDVDQTAEELIKLAEESGEKAFDVLTAAGYGVTVMVDYYSYGLSKLFLNARVKVMKAQPQYKDMILEMVCPGYCATDINGHSGYRTAEQGGETPAWLAVEDFDRIKKREKQVYWTDKEQVPYFVTAE